MNTPTISLLFFDGIVSITAMCFKLLLPLIILSVALLSWPRIAGNGRDTTKNLAFLAGVTFLLLDGVYLVYLMLSYPHSDLARWYLAYRKEAGLILGGGLLGFFGYRLMNLNKETLFSTGASLLAAAGIGLLLTATWAPCIREAVASISHEESGRVPLYLAYISGVSVPFLLLSLCSFGLKFLPFTSESVLRFSTIGIISLILLSLTRILIG